MWNKNILWGWGERQKQRYRSVVQHDPNGKQPAKKMPDLG